MTYLYISKLCLTHLLTAFSHQHPFSGYAYSHTIEEEHNLHDEPYGYELGDDVIISYNPNMYLAL
jgi:hypothetical protein